MITLIGIDPGTTESAFVAMSGRAIDSFAKLPNDAMLARLDFVRLSSDPMTTLVVEMVASYGMPVGREVFETCVWIGRFIERWRGRYDTIGRPAVKGALCNSAKATDSNVRAALIERYGGKTSAIGNAKSPGPLHGVTGDVWSALAVACVYRERMVDVGSGKGLLR